MTFHFIKRWQQCSFPPFTFTFVIFKFQKFICIWKCLYDEQFYQEIATEKHLDGLDLFFTAFDRKTKRKAIGSAQAREHLSSYSWIATLIVILHGAQLKSPFCSTCNSKNIEMN